MRAPTRCWRRSRAPRLCEHPPAPLLGVLPRADRFTVRVLCFRGVPNLVARKLDLEQALASTGSMGEIAVKHREQLDWLKESGAADDGAAEAGGGGAAGSVQWSGRSSQATTKKGWGAIGGGGSLSLKAKTEMLAAKKDSKRIRALEELVGDGTTLEEEAASGALSALLIFAPPRPRSDRRRSRAGL